MGFRFLVLIVFFAWLGRVLCLGALLLVVLAVASLAFFLHVFFIPLVPYFVFVVAVAGGGGELEGG